MASPEPISTYTRRDTERFVAEAEAPGRSAFQRDRARVLHSSALRRLAAKTQVVDPTGDADGVPRTRLTHSLECAQIGRELGAGLGCDPDLVDAACLAHDLGHPPFGHNGETALDLVAQPCGGFEGNAQSLRVLTRLEAKVLRPDGTSAGLNLTRAALDAATKYPWPRRAGTAKYGVYDDDREVFEWLRAGVDGERRCLETAVMDWADDVAYSVHDLEDGIAAGHVSLAALRDPGERAELAAVLDDLVRVPFWPAQVAGDLAGQVALKRLTSSLIARFCRAAEDGTRASYGELPGVRYGADLVVPRQARLECALLKAVTARYVMARSGAAAAQERERELVVELATALLAAAPEALEPLLRPAWAAAPDDAGRLRVVVDQVARLTDPAARRWHARLTGH